MKIWKITGEISIYRMDQIWRHNPLPRCTFVLPTCLFSISSCKLIDFPIFYFIFFCFQLSDIILPFSDRFNSSQKFSLWYIQTSSCALAKENYAMTWTSLLHYNAIFRPTISFTVTARLDSRRRRRNPWIFSLKSRFILSLPFHAIIYS